jgi:hypothetical protein
VEAPHECQVVPLSAIFSARFRHRISPLTQAGHQVFSLSERFTRLTTHRMLEAQPNPAPLISAPHADPFYRRFVSYRDLT